MRWNLIHWIALSLICGLSCASRIFAQGAQPQVVYSQFDPLVIRSDRTQPVLFQAKVINNPTRVALEYNPLLQQTGVDLEMRDDGDRLEAIPCRDWKQLLAVSFNNLAISELRFR